jgi:hypothetical protein
MKKIYIKFYEFHEDGSLIFAVASDETKSQNPDDYSMHCMQPLDQWSDIKDVNEIKKRLVSSMHWHVKKQYERENKVNNPVLVESFKDLIGKTEEYDLLNDLGLQPD